LFRVLLNQGLFSFRYLLSRNFHGDLLPAGIIGRLSTFLRGGFRGNGLGYGYRIFGWLIFSIRVVQGFVPFVSVCGARAKIECL